MTGPLASPAYRRSAFVAIDILVRMLPDRIAASCIIGPITPLQSVFSFILVRLNLGFLLSALAPLGAAPTEMEGLKFRPVLADLPPSTLPA